MNIGKKIQELREKSALTQEMLAEKVGVSRQSVSKWELDQALPEVDKIVALSRLFQVTTDELLITSPVCQSCGMPMKKPEDFGTEQNDEASIDYCCHCYKKGFFDGWAKSITLEEMIDFNVKFCLDNGIYKTLEESRKACEEFYPTLKRWSNITT